MNEAANDSARVSRQDRKIPPAIGTNQTAGFGGFRLFASLEKNKSFYLTRTAYFYVWESAKLHIALIERRIVTSHYHGSTIPG